MFISFLGFNPAVQAFLHNIALPGIVFDMLDEKVQLHFMPLLWERKSKAVVFYNIHMAK